MLIKLVEIKVSSDASKFTNDVGQKYTLPEVFINPEHIVCLREDEFLEQRFLESKKQFPKKLDRRQGFTRLNLQRGQLGIDVVVVGSPKIISKIINTSDQQVI